MIKSKKILQLVLALVTLNQNNLSAQNYSIKDRLGVNISMTTDISIFNYFSEYTMRNYGVGSYYGLLDFLELGPYYRFYRDEFYSPSDNCENVAGGSDEEGNSCPLYLTNYFESRYGIQANLHIFPFFIKSEFFRFDLYLTGKFGGIYSRFSGDSLYPNTHLAEFNFGAGLAYYIGKRFGVYAEYTHGESGLWSNYRSPYTSKRLEVGLRHNFQIQRR